MPGLPAARHIPQRPAARSRTPARAVIAKLADLATRDQRSPLFGAGNAGVIARGGRLFRRDDETRSESYADILHRAGVKEIEARGKGAMDPAAQMRTTPCTRTAPCSPK